MDTEGTDYKCKSGQPQFIYRDTGENRCPTQYTNVSCNRGKYGDNNNNIILFILFTDWQKDESIHLI